MSERNADYVCNVILPGMVTAINKREKGHPISHDIVTEIVQLM
jgi:hypothetical protein